MFDNTAGDGGTVNSKACLPAKISLLAGQELELVFSFRCNGNEGGVRGIFSCRRKNGATIKQCNSLLSPATIRVMGDIEMPLSISS